MCPRAFCVGSEGTLRAKRGPIVEALSGTVREHHRFLFDTHLKAVESLEALIAGIEAQIDAKLVPFAEAVERLQTIPGVGPTAARIIGSEIGFDMSRFKTSGHVVSWAGLCPRMDESAGKRRSTRIRKANLWLKTALVQCAWAAVRKPGYLRAQYLRLKARRGPMKAIIAVAASMLVAAHAILRDGQTFRDLGADYFTRHDQDRVVRRLTQKLQTLGYQVDLRPAA